MKGQNRLVKKKLIVILGITALAIAIVLMSGSAAWATSSQAPLSQTVPTNTPVPTRTPIPSYPWIDPCYLYRLYYGCNAPCSSWSSPCSSQGCGRPVSYHPTYYPAYPSYPVYQSYGYYSASYSWFKPYPWAWNYYYPWHPEGLW